MIPESGNLGDVFRHLDDSDRLAVIDLFNPDAPKEISFKALSAGCDAVARGLQRAGFGSGDRIGILALNRVEFLEVLFGAMRAGLVPVMINVKLPAEQVRFIIADAGAKIIFADREFTVLAGDGPRVVSFDTQGAGSYADFVDPGPYQSFRPGPDDVSEQPYTSGSTGRPKGVLLPHAGQCWMIERLVESRDMGADDCGIVSAPLYHKNALLAVKSALAPGGAVLLLARFDAEQYARAIGRYGLTMLTGVPTMYALLLQQEKALSKIELSGVRAISMGSAPASDVLLQSLGSVFSGATINLNYGITEGGPIMFSWKHPNGSPRPPGTVGYALLDVEIRLGEGDTGVGAAQGILHVKSPGVMSGYHNLPDETAKALHDGWLDTGDILRRDEGGWYYFIGRADDMFVCGGENIYPGDVESLLERHADVYQAVVVPAPNRLKAEVPHAFVVRRPDSTLTEDELKQFALDNGPVYAHPRRVFFVDVLPLAGTNKIDRKGLMEQAADAAHEEGSV